MKSSGRGLAFCICILLSVTPLFAQDNTLHLGSVVEGALDSAEADQYQLTALELTLVSFHLAALEGTLDPVLTIYDSSGKRLISNDDSFWPEALAAVIQVFVIPRLDTYTIEVSAFGDTAGGYRLRVLPGYDTVALHDTELSPSNWEVVTGEAVIAQAGKGRMLVELEGLARSSTLLGTGFPQEPDAYFEVQLENYSSAADGQVGIIFRYLRPDLLSRLLLNGRGFWRIERVDEGDIIVVRNWGTHPAIVAGEKDFRLGLLVSGQHIDVVYNGQVVGTLEDKNIAETGQVGITMRTADVFGSRLSFAVTDVIMTAPTRVAGNSLFPQQLKARNYYAMADVLTRQQLFRVGGTIKMALPESTVRHMAAGVTPYVLGVGNQFADLAVSAKLSLQSRGSENGGCGLLFHHVDDQHYTLAYVTATGDYGVSQRTYAGFATGIYGKRPASDLEKHEMLVIAQGSTLHYYLDGIHVGSMPYTQQNGEVGIAVVNYEPVDTHCIFEDFWVLSADD